MGLSDYWNTAKSWFGYAPEQKVGKDLGRYLGQLGSHYVPIPGVNGSQFGEWVGSFLPFKEGGTVGSWRENFRQLRESQPGYNPGPIMTPPKANVWDEFLTLKNGGRVPLSYSNVRQQMESERMK